MQQIDSRIPLGTQLPNVRGPFQTFGAMAELDELDQRREQQRQLAEQRELVNQQRRRALQDDETVREILARAPRPDDAVHELYRRGLPDAAGAIAKNLFEQRAKAAEVIGKELENSKKKLEIAGNIAASIKDQATFGTGRSAITAVMGDEYGDVLGTEYDPERMKQLVTAGMSAQERITAQKNAFDQWMTLTKFWLLDLPKGQVDYQEGVAKAMAGYRGVAGSLLSTARSQEELDSIQALLAKGGIPPDVIASFGNEWTPDYRERALEKSLTADQQQQKKDRAATRAETARHNQATEGIQRERIAAGVGAGGGAARRPLTPNRKSEVEQRKNNAYRDLQKDIDDEIFKLDEIDETTGKPRRDEDAIGQRKLEIQNGYRAEMGLPPLEEAEFQFASDPSKKKELAEVRKLFREATGKVTPLEALEKLRDEFQKEKDPAKRKEIRDKIDAIRRTLGR